MIPKPLRKTVSTDTTSVQSVRLTQYCTVTDVYGSLTLLFLKVVKSQLVGGGEGTVKRLYRAIPSLNKNLSTSFFLEGGEGPSSGRLYRR
jgi:hypothetical protein